MPYIIDGHNLIPRIPGLALDDIDDEPRMIEMLQEFCRIQRKQVEIYFDNAPPGGTRIRSFGAVVARFIRQGITADDAIRNRLTRLGRDARNWTVVSSDQAVISSARAAQAHYISAEDFARLVLQTLDKSGVDLGDKPDLSVSADEVDNWLQLFSAEQEDE